MATRLAAAADRLAARLAEGQFGLISYDQALVVGHTPMSIRNRVRQRRWVQVLPGVYVINGAPQSWEREAMAAHLWAGDESALSHRTAARAWRFDGFANAGIEISTSSGKRARGLPFVCHRVNRFLVPEIQRIGDLPVTSVRRTLLDLAGVRHPRHEKALDQALRTEATTLGQMWLLYEEEWTRGRRGIAILRGLLVHRTAGQAPTDSDLEDLFMDIVRDFALPQPEQQYPIKLPFDVVHPDFCYPEARLVIETDGYAYHSDRESSDEDKERDAELSLLGWTVLRFSWAQLKWRREWVADIVRQHLEASSGT